MSDSDMPVFRFTPTRRAARIAFTGLVKVKTAAPRPEPADYVKVTMRKSGDAYAMNAKTHEVRRLVPKQFRSKKERVRARRALNGQR